MSKNACFSASFYLSTFKTYNNMKNVKHKYARVHAPKTPGVYPEGLNFLVYARETKGPRMGAITCRRKFATEEAANIFYNGLHPDERI